RALHDRPDAQRDAHGHDPVPRRMSRDREQRGAPAVRQRPPDHEQHTWPGYHDQDQGGSGEGGDLIEGDHAVTLTPISVPRTCLGREQPSEGPRASKSRVEDAPSPPPTAEALRGAPNRTGVPTVRLASWGGRQALPCS